MLPKSPINCTKRHPGYAYARAAFACCGLPVMRMRRVFVRGVYV
jgi:hypothetical protein